MIPVSKINLNNLSLIYRSRLIIKIISWTNLIFYLVLSMSYAEDLKGIDQQSKRLLEYSEKIITNESASEYSLKLIRSRLVKIRSNLLENEKIQLDRVRNLTDQIRAMDSPVLDDEIMSDQLKDLKERLKFNLAEESFPLAFSRSARERADQFIDKIDVILLERFKLKKKKKSPSPLNFLTWGSTILELSAISQEIINQVNKLPEFFIDKTSIGILEPIFFLVFGISLFWLKKFLRKEIDVRVIVAKKKNLQTIFLVLENLIQLILPVLGYFLIFNGLKSVTIFGIYSELFFDYALRMILSIVVARWLVLSLASKSIQVGHLFNFEIKKEKKVIRLVTFLAINFSTLLLIEMLNKGFNLSQISLVNLYFPIIIITALTLFNLSKIIKTAENYKAFTERSFTFSKIIRKFIFAATIVIPVLTAFGYLEASLYFLKGIILSLAVAGGAHVGFRVLDVIIKNVFNFQNDISSTEELRTLDKLISSFAAFIIIIISLIVISLVWGLGINNLQDIWFRINEGVPFGSSRITPSSLAKFLIIFSLGYILTRFLQTLLKEKILPSTNLDAGGKGALLSGLGYIGYFLAGILALSSTGLDLSSLAILAGALSVGLGFGMQTIVSNFVCE